MGTMRFAAGSHREGYLGDMPISDDSEAHLEEFLRACGFREGSGQAMAAGDATFHYG